MHPALPIRWPSFNKSSQAAQMAVRKTRVKKTRADQTSRDASSEKDHEDSGMLVFLVRILDGSLVYIRP